MTKLVKPIELIELETTPSLGVAPVYWVKIYSDRAEYEGISNTRLEGSYECSISPAKIDMLHGLVEENSIGELKRNYASGGTCGSFEILKVHFSDGDIKEVQDYRNSGPQSLKILKDAIHSLIAECSWTQVPARRVFTRVQIEKAQISKKCHCGSGKRIENCHGLVR